MDKHNDDHRPCPVDRTAPRLTAEIAHGTVRRSVERCRSVTVGGPRQTLKPPWCRWSIVGRLPGLGAGDNRAVRFTPLYSPRCERVGRHWAVVAGTHRHLYWPPVGGLSVSWSSKRSSVGLSRWEAANVAAAVSRVGNLPEAFTMFVGLEVAAAVMSAFLGGT